MADFYDELAPLYHLIFEDWSSSVDRQGEKLAAIIRREWAGHKTVLDGSCGIGTQAIGLAKNGFQVTASDISAKEIERARKEAEQQRQRILFSVCDMRSASSHHRRDYDIAISCDNSLPHLLTDEDIVLALKEMFRCIRPGGGILITVRDYDREERGRNLVKPYGVREQDGKRYLVFQVWDFEGDRYDLTMYFVEEEMRSKKVTTHVMRTRYYAIGVGTLLTMMEDVGFEKVSRHDGDFYQPVLTGTKR